jgi:hypothetical protein
VVCFIVADKINSTCWSSHILKAILDRYEIPPYFRAICELKNYPE